MLLFIKEMKADSLAEIVIPEKVTLRNEKFYFEDTGAEVPQRIFVFTKRNLEVLSRNQDCQVTEKLKIVSASPLRKDQQALIEQDKTMDLRHQLYGRNVRDTQC